MPSVKLLDKNNNTAILLAGILSIIIGLGVARFVFTSLLPSMLENYLSIKFAGILASVNYVGYLGGSIFSMFIKDINQKVMLFRIGIILSILTTLVLALSINDILWLISRILAGFGSAMVFVVGSAIVMMKLKMENKIKAMGVHFSGIGFSILVTDLIIRGTLGSGLTWENSWLVLALFGVILSPYCVYILSFDKKTEQKVIKYKFDKSLFSFFAILIIMSYFTAGVGFVIEATFLPDIINSVKGLEGYGGLTWTLVGIASIPSCIILMTLASKKGSVNVIIIAMLAQIVGILIPIFTKNMYLNLFSGILYGGTFAGLVALFMNLSGKLAESNPVALMGAATTSYGIGQVSAPLYSVYFVQKYGNYDYALFLTALILFSGVLLLLFSKIIMSNKERKLQI